MPNEEISQLPSIDELRCKYCGGVFGPRDVIIREQKLTGPIYFRHLECEEVIK